MTRAFVPRLRNAARWLAYGLFAVLMVLWLWSNWFHFGIFWVILIVFWQWLPVGAAQAWVRASNTKGGAAGVLLLEAALATWAIVVALDSFLSLPWLPAESPLFNPVFSPAFPLGGMVVVLTLSYVLGWQPREGWRED